VKRERQVKGKSEPVKLKNGSKHTVQSAELDRGKSMVHTGLPNMEDAKIPFSSASSVFISPAGPVQRS
jgi:hypothetical protein